MGRRRKAGAAPQDSTPCWSKALKGPVITSRADFVASTNTGQSRQLGLFTYHGFVCNSSSISFYSISPSLHLLGHFREEQESCIPIQATRSRPTIKLILHHPEIFRPLSSSQTSRSPYQATTHQNPRKLHLWYSLTCRRAA